jgi:hypothetical protein
MPFTVSHALAAVPLRRALGPRAVPSALVIGTMVPDFWYFIPVVDRLDSHSFPALFWFALPVGLATYLLFHLWLREPALALLPPGVRSRVGALASGPRPPWPAVAAGLLAGAASHIAWDVPTHATTTWDPCRTVVATIGRHHVPLYSVLQHGSSVGGLVLLGAWCRRWLAARPVDDSVGAVGSPATRWAAVALLLVVPPLAAIARFMFAARHGEGVRHAGGLAVRTGGLVFGATAVLLATTWHARVASRSPPRKPPAA